MQEGINEHRIWTDIKYWERCIYSSIEEELEEQRNYVEQDRSNLTKQIVFAKLCSLQHDMLCFPSLDRG